MFIDKRAYCRILTSLLIFSCDNNVRQNHVFHVEVFANAEKHERYKPYQVDKRDLLTYFWT